MNSFRIVNDRIRAQDGARDPELAFFVCECASSGCFRTVPLTPGEYDGLRGTGGIIFAGDCTNRPVLADVIVGGRARLVIGPDVDLADVLRHWVAMPVRDAGLPVEGAPAG